LKQKFGKLAGKWKYMVIFTCIVLLVAVLSPAYISAGSSEQVEAFVSRFYQVCLDRQPDEAGLNKWVEDLLSGVKTGADVAKGFMFSKEFTDKNLDNASFLTIAYRAFFNREPDAAGYDVWLKKLNNGTSRQTVVDGFSQSQEFSQLCSSFGITPYAGAKTTAGSTSTSTSSGLISGTAAGFASGNKVNFIIWGDDSGIGRPGGRVNGRTDQNLFVHINLDTQKATITPIARDTWTSIPGHGNGKINGAHAMGGNDLAERTFEQFTGIPIDFYVITDMDGLPALINTLGGVTVTVEENISDTFSNCYMTPGTWTINGDQALALCRARHGRSLYGGGAFAREYQAAMLIKGLLLQKRDIVNSSNLPDVLNMLSGFVWSNITLDMAARILPALLAMGDGDISIQKFNQWPKNYGKASAVGYDTAEKNAFFANIAAQ
jgi:LCP family protein required for cell wall assembly